MTQDVAHRRSGRVVPLAAAAALAAFAVVLYGGYVGHWKWTGFAENDSLWDWLHLLLLPIAVAALPIVLRHAGRLGARRRRALAGALALFVALVLAGYLFPLPWTGFPGNTLWDWLELVVLPAALVVLPLFSEVRRELRVHHWLGLWLILTTFVVLAVLGYAARWAWTGFPGNTLWDWLQLFLVPLLLPTVLTPVALAWLAAEVEEEEEEALGAPGGPASGHAPPAPRQRAVALLPVALGAVVAVGAGAAIGSQVDAGNTQRTAAAPAASMCAEAGTPTVAAFGAIRVVRAGDGFYACRPGARGVLIVRRDGRPGPGSFRVSGRRVVFADERCRGDACSTAIEVLRLGRDAHPFVRHRFTGTGPVADLAVSPRGALAVMLRDRCGPGAGAGCGGRLYLLDGRGTTLAGAGPQVDPASLAQHGATVYWRTAGRAASAQLTG